MALIKYLDETSEETLMNSEYASIVFDNAIRYSSSSDNVTEASKQFSINLWNEFIKQIYNDKYTKFIKLLIRAYKKTNIKEILYDENYEEILNKCYVDE